MDSLATVASYSTVNYLWDKGLAVSSMTLDGALEVAQGALGQRKLPLTLSHCLHCTYEQRNFLYRAGVPRRRGVPLLHPRRRFLPQLPRHPEVRGGAHRRRSGAVVHHRGVAGHHGRRHQRLNIGTNISLGPDFNEMVGFTEPEVRHLVETYRELGVFNQDATTAMDIMGEWYKWLPVRQGSRDRSVQHRHGAVLSEAFDAEP